MGFKHGESLCVILNRRSPASFKCGLQLRDYKWRSGF